MSRIGVSYSLLGHDSAEEVDYRVMVGHEAPLVVQLVEENVLAVDREVRVRDLPVNCYLPLDLVLRIVFCYPEIGLAELAVAAASPHNLDKPVSRRTLNIRDVLQLRPTRNMNELGTVSRLDVIVNITDHMVTLAYHYVVDA